MKIRVGFIISDKIYIERLVSTLNRYYSDKLEIYSYTDVKVANESVENQRLDIVIVDETLQVNEYRNCCMAYFVESPDIDKIEGKKAICKFQKVELIYKDILALYSEYSSRITKRKRSGELAEVITFTSPACGSGVTSMAAAFALNCSLNNKSALYLSMENIPTTDIIFDGEGKYTLTDVVYAVKSKRSNLSMKLESFAITDSANVDYFAAPKNPMDLHEMNDEDVELLISELKSIDALSLVIEGDGNKHKITKKHELLSLDELSDLVWEYYSDYNDWKGNATESKTSLGTEQRTEVGTYEKEKRDVDGDDVVEFKNKLIKEREALQSIVDAIDSIKYGSKKLTDIKNFDTFYSQFKNKFTNPTEPIRNSRIDIDGHDIYYKLLTPQKTEALIPVPECKLILEKGDDTYYDFLLTRGYESDGKSLKDLKKDVDEKDGKIDDFKKQKEDAENSEDTKKDKSGSDEIKNSSNVNVGEYEGSKFGAGTLLKGFAQTIENFANQKGPNVRDSLYATLYTMNMFSYRTYVYEGKYDDYTDSYGDEITYENCEEKYKTVSSNWADEKATYTYNKSLTNHMINNANNAAFNAEVEYVLYGSTNEENLKSAYANIYEIRLALNLASGYLNFWSAGKNTTADVINGAADLIAEITRHIIPAPVTKAVLIALLAALESIQDMKILNKGIPLEVYKVSDEQWSYSINKKGDSKDDVGISDPKSPKKGEGICMQYSDYLFIFLYSMFQSGDDKTNKAYCRLGRLIEANMQKVDKDHPQFSLKQSKTLFTLTSEIDVSPLMMDQPLASDYKDSLADGSWNRYTIEVTRGY